MYNCNRSKCLASGHSDSQFTVAHVKYFFQHRCLTQRIFVKQHMEILARQKQTWKWRLLFSDERSAALCPKGLDLINWSHRLQLGDCTFHINCVCCEKLAQAAGSEDKTRRKWETSTTTWSVTQTRFKSKRDDNRAVMTERDEGVKREKVYLTKILTHIFTAHFVTDESFQVVTNIPKVSPCCKFLSPVFLSLLPKHTQINLKHFPQSSIIKDEQK